MTTIRLNPIPLPNVVFGPKLQDMGIPKEQMYPTYEHDPLRELLWELASRNPLWDFTISKSSVHKRDEGVVDGLTHTLFIREITITSEREVLGSFTADYHGATRKLFITNERIAKERTGRNQGRMATSDVKRAYREIVKNFYSKNPKERATEAASLIAKKLGDIDRKTSHSVYQFDHEFQTAVSSFVKRNPQVLTTFPHVDLDRNKAVSSLESLNAASEAKDKIATVQMTMANMWSSLADPSKHKAPDNAAVVISQGSTYVLTYKGQICTIPSEDLPEELRGPLGMLKLSDAMQLIDGIGFRIDDKIFLVFTQESNDA
jgi:hypothetical protein